jgi:hypothetical protein
MGIGIFVGKRAGKSGMRRAQWINTNFETQEMEKDLQCYCKKSPKTPGNQWKRRFRGYCKKSPKTPGNQWKRRFSGREEPNPGIRLKCIKNQRKQPHPQTLWHSSNLIQYNKPSKRNIPDIESDLNKERRS